MAAARRVVMFTAGMAEPGGAARRSRLIAYGLAARGWQVRGVTRAGTLRSFRLHRATNLLVLEVPGFGRRRTGGALFVLCALPLGLLWGMRASRFVAVQLLSQATVAAVCSLVLGRPYLALASTSGKRVSEVRYLVEETRLKTLRRRLLGRAAVLIAQTPAAAEELRAFAPSERIAVLPNPVAAVDAPPLDGAPRAAYSGRFSEEKDLPRLLDAWRVVAEELPGATLTLVGEGGGFRSVEDALRRTVAADPVLARTVTFTGWVPDVGPYLRAADVYVFPSLDEGMSNALLEACAWGRVVVASDIAPNRAVVGDDYPLLFAAADTDGLVTALRRAFTDESARTDSLAAIERRLGSFSPEAVIGRLERLLDAADSPRH
jgi:glycosyltransferase involved in cell wall biosynthesis